MQTFAHGAATWDVECPHRRSRVTGVTMAGFRVADLDALRIVPHPAVTLLAVDDLAWPGLGTAGTP